MAQVNWCGRQHGPLDPAHSLRGDLHFLINNGPGPFKLVASMVHWFEQLQNKFVVELTVRPAEVGEELLGHTREFKIPFEIALMGPTTCVDWNFRLLGRFWITPEVQRGPFPLVDPSKAASELDTYQWEVVFFPDSRRGLVFKLKQPIPCAWTF